MIQNWYKNKYIDIFYTKFLYNFCSINILSFLVAVQIDSGENTTPTSRSRNPTTPSNAKVTGKLNLVLSVKKTLSTLEYKQSLTNN